MSHPRTPLAPVDPRQAGAIQVPEDMLRAGSNYVLRVSGTSLEDEQIRDGDYIIVNARTTPERGEMVVASVGGDTIVRQFYSQADGRVQLRPSDRSLPAMILPADQIRIEGIVVGIVRKY
ncbi:MAG: S24 family peptidase [Gemmatimonadota bacterium]